MVAPTANRRNADSLAQQAASGLPSRDMPAPSRRQPALRDPSRAELFQCSRGHITRTLKNQKTYRRFSGTIFFGEVELVEHPQLQPLAGHKIPKNRKNTKKSVIFLERPPRFSAKSPQKRPFFAVSTFFSPGPRLALALMERNLRRFRRPRFFRAHNRKLSERRNRTSKRILSYESQIINS